MFVGLGVRVAVGSGVELGVRAGVRVGLAVMLDRGVAVGDCPAGSVAGILNAQAEAHSAKLASTVRLTRLIPSCHPTCASFQRGPVPPAPDLDRRGPEANWRTET